MNLKIIAFFLCLASIAQATVVSNCQVINTAGYYELTADLDGGNPLDYCIQIQASNVHFNGNFHTITTKGKVDDDLIAFYVAGPANAWVQNITIANLSLIGWNNPIMALNADRLNFSSLHIVDNQSTPAGVDANLACTTYYGCITQWATNNTYISNVNCSQSNTCGKGFMINSDGFGRHYNQNLTMVNIKINGTNETGIRVENTTNIIIQDVNITNLNTSVVTLSNCNNVSINRLNVSYVTDNLRTSLVGDAKSILLLNSTNATINEFRFSNSVANLRVIYLMNNSIVRLENSSISSSGTLNASINVSDRAILNITNLTYSCSNCFDVSHPRAYHYGANLTVSQPVKVYVIDGSGIPVSGAYVNVSSNKSIAGSQVLQIMNNELIAASGYTDLKNATEAALNNSMSWYLNNYVINVTKSGYSSNLSYSTNLSNGSKSVSIILYSGGGSSGTFPADWWNSSWLYRIKLPAFSCPGGGCSNNAPLLFKWTNSTQIALASAGGADLRYVTNCSGVNTSRGIWIRNFTSSGVSLALNTTNDSTCDNYLYLGNPSAPSVSSPFNVLTVFDDYSTSTFNSTTWQFFDNAPIQLGNGWVELHYDAPSASKYLYASAATGVILRGNWTMYFEIMLRTAYGKEDTIATTWGAGNPGNGYYIDALGVGTTTRRVNTYSNFSNLATTTNGSMITGLDSSVLYQFVKVNGTSGKFNLSRWNISVESFSNESWWAINETMNRTYDETPLIAAALGAAGSNVSLFWVGFSAGTVGSPFLTPGVYLPMESGLSTTVNSVDWCEGSNCTSISSLYYDSILNCHTNVTSTTNSTIAYTVFMLYQNGVYSSNKTVYNQLNNTNIPMSLNGTLSGFTKGDTWVCGAWANDISTQLDSTGITINNTAPVTGTPSISSNDTVFLNTSILTCSFSYSDADGDTNGTGYYTWYKNNVFYPNLNFSTVNLTLLSNSTNGDIFNCSAFQEDSGYSPKNSSPLMSSAVTIGYSSSGSVNITNCSSGFNVLNFTLWDEETMASMNGTMEITVTLYNSSLSYLSNNSFIYTNQHVFPICIIPYAATAYIDTFQAYYSNYTLGQYPQRNYFLLKALLNVSNPQVIPIYLENSSYAKQTTIFVQDETSRGIPGVYVAIQRFYPGTNTYTLIAMTKTNVEGYGTAYLRPVDIYYRFIAYDSSGTSLASFTPAFIPCDPGDTACRYFLQIKPETTGYYWQAANGIIHNCSYSNSTGSPIVACTFMDTTGLTKNASLVLSKISGSSMAIVCTNTTTGTFGTLICNVPNAPGTYGWRFTVGINPTLMLETGEYTWGQVVTFGAFGLFMGALFIIALSILGAMFGSPPLAIAFGTIGFLASWLMNLIVVAPQTVIGVIVIAGVLIFLTRRT